MNASPALLWGLLRPRGLPWVLSLPLFGFGFAHWSWALPLRGGEEIACVLAAWTCVHAGTMWLNAGLDRDEGEVLLGRPLPVPDHIARYAAVALIAGPCLAALAGTAPFVCAAACALLAVLYSDPNTAWKGHPIGGPAVNIVGYAVLSPIAGWSVVGVVPGMRTFAALSVVIALVTGIYFAAQAFQRDEDAARGYRTLVVTHGPATALAVARASFGVGFAVLVALIAAGWFPRACALALPAIVLVDRHLAAWSAGIAVADRPGGAVINGEASARELAYRLMLVAALLVLGAYVAYVGTWFGDAGAPASGLATVAGFPG